MNYSYGSFGTSLVPLRLSRFQRASSWDHAQIDPDLFYESLQNLGLRARHSAQPPALRLRDASFDKIRTLLDLRGKGWQKLTKTFVVLYQCDLEDLMDDFVREERTDYSLPYTMASLPNALLGDDRRRFLDYQENVLTSHGDKIERGQSKHLHLRSSASNLFVFKALLGRGGFAEVEHVVGKSTWQHFALKRIPRSHFDESKNRKSLFMFQTELSALQALTHQHMVELVGSYTDNEHVGLLLKPVADRNLATFLHDKPPKAAMVERYHRLRGFFGCIATAVDYLHNNNSIRVQHKDIKPANILIKNANVYIADFGSARLRVDEPSDTTEPTANNTMHFLTRKYAAPEATAGTRTFASDIWSLGCVFLEMLTALSGKSLDEIDAFFRLTASRSTVYQENMPALNAWLDHLHQVLLSSNAPEDAQLTGIIKTMCLNDQSKRVEASDLVRRLFNLEGGPYHGACCNIIHGGPDLQQSTVKSLHSRNEDASDESNDSDNGDTIQDGEIRIAAVAAEVKEESTKRNAIMSQGPSYVIPSVEDCDTTSSISANEPPRVAAHLLEDVTEVIYQRPSTIIEPNDGVFVEATTDDDGSGSSLRAQSPMLEGLQQGQTGVKLSCLGTRSTRHTSRTQRAMIETLPDDPLPCSWPTCKPQEGVAPRLFDGVARLRKHLRDRHLTHDFGISALYSTCVERDITLSIESGRFTLARGAPGESREDPAPRRSPTTREMPAAHPAARASCEPQRSPRTKQTRPTLLEPPATVMIPSLFLASMNCVPLSDITRRTPPARPLFVYGTLMFPSILRCLSESFIGLQGTYSMNQSRRLRTTAKDWNGTNTSITAAAKCMASARAKGYARFKLPQHGMAYLVATDDNVATNGFVITGLSSEALCCLDFMYQEGREGHKTEKANRLVRQTITVSVDVHGGSSVYIEAEAYMLKAEDKQSSDRVPWDIDQFLCSRDFNRLTNSMENGKGLEGEEAIARIVGTALVLPGDALVERIFNDDIKGLDSAIQEGYDADALSVKYGTALQAAASRGKLDMMSRLLAAQANVDATGGEYGSALIAAVVENHLPAVKFLLRHNAQVFTPGGKYVDALYQAVDFDRLEIAHALLEKGAWLTKDYRELLDLAAERDNEEMYGELIRYDVRGRHSSQRSPRLGKATDQEESRIISIRQRGSDSLGATCLFEVIRLHNQPGKWTGIKGVRLVRVLLDYGLDDGALEKVKPFIHSFPAIQSFLADAATAYVGGRFRPVRHSDPDAKELTEEVLRSSKNSFWKRIDEVAPNNSEAKNKSFATKFTSELRRRYG